MKKTVVLVLALALIAGSLAAPALAKKKKKKPVRVERVVELDYSAPGIGATVAGSGGGICPFADPTTQECIEVPLQVGEAYVKVELVDATGQKVSGSLSQGDTDGDGIGNLYGQFCGAHEAPIKMESTTVPLRISFYNGTCDDGTPAPATTGTITVTFSNLP